MALPTTNLTARWDASIQASLYAGLDGSNLPTGAVTDLDDVGAWESQVNSAHLWIPNTNVAVFNPPDIIWRDDTVLTLPSVKIAAGTMEAVTAGTLSDLLTSDFHTASAKTLIFSFLLEDGTLLKNSSTVYLNSALLGNPQNNFYGMFLRNNSGTFTLSAYNWDGNSDAATVTILEDTKYVVVVTHDGVTLTLSLRSESGGIISETTQTAASGNTTNINISWRLADSNAAGSEQVKIRIGEIATYNAVLSGATMTDAKTYFNRWFIGDNPVPIVGSAIFGKDGRVSSTRTFLANLDDVSRTVHLPGAMVIGGYLALLEQATPPTATAGVMYLWVEDNGSGKLRLMAQPPSGSAQQIVIEP
jgi:hypothetical protein